MNHARCALLAALPLCCCVGCGPGRAVTVPMIIHDPAGKPVQDCLMLRCRIVFEGDEGLGESARGECKVTQAELVRIGSGQELEHPVASVSKRPTYFFLMTHIEEVRHEYLIAMEGYAPQVIRGSDIVRKADNHQPLVITLAKEPVRPEGIRFWWEEYETLLYNAVPVIAKDDPLRGRFLTIVGRYTPGGPKTATVLPPRRP